MAEYQPLSDDEMKKELETLPNWEVRDGWLRREYKTPGFPHSLLLANTIGYLAEAGLAPPGSFRRVRPGHGQAAHPPGQRPHSARRGPGT